MSNDEALARLAEHRIPFLVREWFFLFVALLAVGEGVGLYFLVRDSPLAIWALTAWTVGLTIGIVEDAAVIALIGQVADTYPDASAALRDSMRFTAGLAFETIKVQQFVSLVLGCGIGYCLFSIIGYRLGKFPLWLCIVGVLGSVTAGWCFGFWNVVIGGGRALVLLENGFALLVVWDLAVGILLLSEANKPA